MSDVNCLKCGHPEGVHYVLEAPTCGYGNGHGCSCQWFDSGRTPEHPGIDPKVNRLLEKVRALELQVSEHRKAFEKIVDAFNEGGSETDAQYLASIAHAELLRGPEKRNDDTPDKCPECRRLMMPCKKHG